MSCQGPGCTLCPPIECPSCHTSFVKCSWPKLLLGSHIERHVCPGCGQQMDWSSPKQKVIKDFQGEAIIPSSDVEKDLAQLRITAVHDLPKGATYFVWRKPGAIFWFTSHWLQNAEPVGTYEV